MMMAIQLVQTLSRDARLRDSADLIHAEVGKLLKDVRLMGERAARLEQHFRQAQEDVAGVAVSADRISRRAERIDQMEFDEEAKGEPLPQLKLARGAD
jgi:DNA recombination protein RmuC